jgi:hypothetical protein
MSHDAPTPTALLYQVTRAGFLPPSERPEDALLAEEGRLRSEVDDFAASFFDTPVASRRQRWQALSARCAAQPSLAARLAALEPGLGLDLRLGDIDNPRTAQLASHVAGLFVLDPVARATQRQAVLRSLQTDIAGWEETARQLQAVFPALAALEPTLLTSILTWREQQQRLARVRSARQPLTSRPATRPAPRPEAAAPSRSGGKAIGWGAVIAIIFTVRLCGGLARHSWSPAPPPQDPFPQFPRVDPEQPERLRRLMEEVERRNREMEDRLKGEGDKNNGQQGWQQGDEVPRGNGAGQPLPTVREDKAPGPRPQPRKP